MMKKISKLFLVIICIVLLLNNSQKVYADEYNLPDIENFTFEIIPKIRGKETEVDIKWQTSKEIVLAEFDVVMMIDGVETTEQPFAWPNKDNSNCEISKINEKIDGVYYHHVRFDILSGKVGTCRVQFNYQIHESHEHSYNLYFTSGNANINNLQYNTKNIILVTTFVTIGAIAATYAIILVSERSKSDSESSK